MHNSFTVEQREPRYIVRSHNFPECTGDGSTLNVALNQMNRCIDYIQDNDPVRYYANLKQRLQNHLECNCGHKLTEKPLGFYAKGKIEAFGS